MNHIHKSEYKFQIHVLSDFLLIMFFSWFLSVVRVFGFFLFVSIFKSFISKEMDKNLQSCVNELGLGDRVVKDYKSSHQLSWKTTQENYNLRKVCKFTCRKSIDSNFLYHHRTVLRSVVFFRYSSARDHSITSNQPHSTYM